MDSNITASNIREAEGDLFDAPDGTALIHACNCQGSWGKGIAQAFRIKYPAAFTVYKSHCDNYLKDPQDLEVSEAPPGTGQISRRIRLPEGSALIIPPQKRDYERPRGKKHWIICLFTSRGYGRSLSSVNVILENTQLAVVDMKNQLDVLRSKEFGPENMGIAELRSCRFNSGLFKVEWAHTRNILEESGLEITVVRPVGEPA
ncbi:uncharacterized protein BJX67DRAFT_88216 [Aspergillus lucknowensis]|uniref:ADP-ribose 1''-phosphate phosphatase n=1 Tax=Aspergillus lucknowensis TaxID=176173 RepID=A0ABR4M5C3_9EURO